MSIARFQLPGAHLEYALLREPERCVVRGQIHEPGLGTERHRVPVVTAERSGEHELRLLEIVALLGLDRTPARLVDARRPGDGDVGLGGDQLAGRAVEHVEEAVLRRLHQHLALRASDLEIGEHDRLHRGVVPVLARRGLVVPGEAAGVGTDREDRRQVQVVAAAGAARDAAPGRAVAGADVEQVELRVVGHRVPRRSAAADLPPLAGPGLRGGLHLGVLERQRRIAGHGEEAPELRAGLRVVRGDVAAHAELRAAVADHHLALHHARRRRDRVGLRAVDRDDFPVHGAGRGVERDEPAVERADEHGAVPDRDAAVHDVAAGVAAPLARHLRIVLPQLLAGDGVERVRRRSTTRSGTSRRRPRSVSPRRRAASRGRTTRPGRASSRCRGRSR